MTESNYWQVTLQTTFENDKGRVQKVRELYLTDAISATEAEAEIYKRFDGQSNFEVVSVVKSRILEII